MSRSEALASVPASMSRDQLQDAANLLGTVSHPVRLGVLVLLDEHGTLSAGELAEHLQVEASSLSHQLRLLKQARLVVSERNGRRILYALHDHHVAHIVRDALEHVAHP